MRLRTLRFLLIVITSASSAIAQSPWTPVQNVPNIGAGAMALLTDGRVLIHDESGNPGTWGNWWTLTPDINGNYVTGTWTQVASLPSGYGPLYFASAVLPDGRYIIEGGLYNLGADSWSNRGAIYDPVANTWTTVSPPSGWASIGNGPSAVLASGTFFMGSCCGSSPQAALLDASTLTWTSTGSGKFDSYNSEGLTLLPGGDLLDVDTYTNVNDPTGKNYETYNPGTGTWTVQGMTPVQLWDSFVGCDGDILHSIGPAVLTANGAVFQSGSASCAGGPTAIYTVSSASWVAGPTFPDNLDVPGGPAALEINGNVLVMTSPATSDDPGAVFFEWNGSALNRITGPPNAFEDFSFDGHLLMLPNGQILFTDFSNDVELFTSTGSTYTGWTPSVLLQTTILRRGTTVRLSGFKFNGATQNNTYGSGFQDATNYPLVRFTNSAGQVYYARTHNHSTMAVGYNGPTFTYVDIPTTIPAGGYTLQVVTNGIASAGYRVGLE
jgi:hypothetical protein